MNYEGNSKSNKSGSKTNSASDNITKSAQMSAYINSFTSIHNAKEIYKSLIENPEIKIDQENISQRLIDKLVPHYEAQAITLDKLVKATGIKQVLFIEEGFSSRGLDTTADKDMIFVEMCPPVIFNEKQRIKNALVKNKTVPDRTNLQLESGSPLNTVDLINATRHFDEKKPIIVLSEGSVQFFAPELKIRFSQNVETLLKNFGGAWINPVNPFQNVDNLDDSKKERVFEIMDSLGAVNQMNLFKDEYDAKLFFQSAGFKVMSFNASLDIEGVLSFGQLDEISKQRVAVHGNIVCFVMTLQEKTQAGLPL